jgi:Flp pilus assembly CpaF family ATPase
MRIGKVKSDGSTASYYRLPRLVSKVKSDGSTASYYRLPRLARELQHLVSHKNMNGQIAEIFRACYRYGEVEHSEMLRDAKKIKFYAEAEIERLTKWSK